MKKIYLHYFIKNGRTGRIQEDLKPFDIENVYHSLLSNIKRLQTVQSRTASSYLLIAGTIELDKPYTDTAIESEVLRTIMRIHQNMGTLTRLVSGDSHEAILKLEGWNELNNQYHFEIRISKIIWTGMDC